MPTLGKTKVSPSLISTGSLFEGTSSYAVTASYAMNGGSGGSGGSTQTGSIANQTILYNVTTSQDNVISGLNLSSNKWGVTVVEEWNSGSIVGDEYYSSCSLLMHFSGSNGSTTFIDNSPSPKTATSNNGASISTVQSKFGGTSGLFDGGDDYVTVPDNSEFDFGAGDFTIEYWEYRTSNAVFKPVMSRNSSGQPPWMIGWTEAGNINFFAGNGSSWSIASAVSMGVIIINSWTHYAVTRQGNTFRTFQNGTQISTFTSTATIPNGAAPLEIGRYAATYYYPGYLDELRLTKGVARYTGSFVTQSVEFPNNLNVTQLQTKYIGLVGGLNDSNVDYGVEKLSDSSLKIRKMTASGQPLSGSGQLSASVDRVYVNVLNYDNVSVLPTASYALTASYAMNGGSGGSGGAVQTGSIAGQTILYNVTTSQDNVITGLNLSSNKWGVSVIEEWNNVSGDIYYPSCSLLLHFSGSNGSTTFTDNSPSPKTVTATNGAAISTAQSKFGGASVFLDGTNDYLSTNSTSAFTFGTGDFTIELWIYQTVSSVGAYKVLVGDNVYGSVGGWQLYSYNNQLNLWKGGTELIAPSGTLTLNSWNHVVWTRASGNNRIFINGTQVGTTVSDSTNYILTAIYIGAAKDGYGYYAGYIDELRITKGVARYTASFATQSIEFPNQLPQYETKYVGLVGGINDSTVDYGIEKLSDSSLKIRKMTATGQPLSGSGSTLSASVDRVYVNVLDYTNVMVTSSYALTASYVLGGIQTGSISNQTILYNVTTSQENTITGLDLSGNKWDVSVIEEWNSGSVPGDLYYNSCSLLMHFSGSNGSTTFIDNSPNNLTVTSNNGTAISTVQSKFGGASAFFDGTNDYLSTPNTVSNFGTDDFTIECWFYRVSTNSILISNATGADNNYFAINADASNAVIQIRDNSSQAFAYGPATTLNVWNHIAVTRNAGTVRVFVNGVSGTPVSITKSFTSRSTIIGGFLYTGFEGYFYGYIDELRITKGIARYTSSFATQSIEFSNQVPQYETKYIGLVGGLNDTNVDYGVEKLSDSSLKIRKMSVSGTPISGSPFLSASVDRVYVNVLNYKEVQTTAQSASYAVSSSYVINAPSGESFHPFLLG
jgi:hypothetical protein